MDGRIDLSALRALDPEYKAVETVEDLNWTLHDMVVTGVGFTFEEGIDELRIAMEGLLGNGKRVKGALVVRSVVKARVWEDLSDVYQDTYELLPDARVRVKLTDGPTGRDSVVEGYYVQFVVGSVSRQ